jgi:Holliday junction DNA helicase RuvA
MIALLTGIIAYKGPDTLILDVGGVGYRVQIPFSTYFDLPDEGGKTTLHIHTNVKEDAINLYGFRSSTEKSFFQLLLTVSGVGPKLARDILSNCPVGDLAAALLCGDIVRLSAIPGIGKKTAERLILELKDKVAKLDISLQSKTGSASIASTVVRNDVASALVNLGYKELQVNKVLNDLEAPDGAAMETVLKLALKQLMK